MVFDSLLTHSVVKLSEILTTAFIHAFILAISLAPLQRCSRLQHRYCIGVSRRSAQATVSKELAQGSYVAARSGIEPTTLRLRVIDLTNAPPRPTIIPQLARCSKHFLRLLFKL